MLQSSPVVAFIGATDLEAARDFYGGTLGLTVEEIGHFACVFRTGDCTIRVTRVPDLRPQSFTVLGWDVSDIRAVISELVRDGVQFRRYDGIEQDDDGIWVTPGGDLVAWFTDPDGNVLSLTQTASD